MSTTDINNAKEILNAGTALAKPFEIANVPAVLVPEGAGVQTFEKLLELDHPRHTQKIVKTRNTEQFINYFNRFCNGDSSIYINVDDATFTGIIDHHGTDTPAYGYHNVTYACPETKEWQAWQNNNEKWMSQTAFAEFLEEHHLQIFKPSPEQFKPEELDVNFDKLPDAAHMLEIASTLEIRSKSNIKSGQNLRNGAIKFEYIDEVEGSAGAKGEFEIPTYFVIGVELFKEGKGYLILCRLKYRKQGPDISLRYDLVRPHKTHEHAVQDIIDRIKNGAPDPENDGEFLPSTNAETQHIYEII